MSDRRHTAHMRDGSRYKWFARGRNMLGPGIHKIWGISADDRQDLQAIQFDTEQFTIIQAQAWLADNDYVPLKFEAAEVKA